MATRLRPPTWSQAVDQFAAHLVDDEKSPLTLRAYTDDLHLFATWYETANQEPPALAELAKGELLAWKQHLVDDRKLAPQTVNRKLAALASFLKWAETEGLARPIQNPKKVRQATPLPRWLERREQNALVRAVEKAGDPRHVAIVTVLLHVGLRVSELGALLWSDIKMSERKGELTVRQGKGRKLRTVPLNSEARKALYDLGAGKHRGQDQAVITSQRGAMTIRGIQSIVEHYGDEARLDKLTVHMLRHTFCRRLAEAGTRLEQIAALAGHESLDTTRRYVEPGQAELAAEVERLAGAEADPPEASRPSRAGRRR